jgi:hypothetical protein
LSTFPTKIIVATDGSEEGLLAAFTAADLVKTIGAEVHMVVFLQDSACVRSY